MSIFPFIDVTADATTEDSSSPIPKEYAIDFTTGEFVLSDGKHVVVEGTDAIKVWTFKALRTQRFIYAAYNFDYGNELENLVGGTKISNQAFVSEVQRYLEEALSINPYIKSVRDIDVSQDNENLSLSFTVITDFGEVQINNV